MTPVTPVEVQQALLELDDNARGNARLDKKLEAATKKHKDSQSPVATTLRDRSINSLIPVMQTFISRAAKTGVVPAAKRFLKQLEAESSAYLICTTMLNELLSYKVGRFELEGKLADAILNELRWLKSEEIEPELVGRSREKFKLLHTEDVRYMLNSLLGSLKSSDELKDALKQFNDPDDRERLGHECFELFQHANPGMFECKTEVISEGRDKVTSPSIVFATPETRLEMDEQYDSLRDQEPLLSPMLVKPARWTNPGDGAYGFSQAKYLQLIKKRNGRSLKYLADAHMPTVYTAINALQETPWRVNRRVYEVVCQIEDLGNHPKPANDNQLKTGQR